MITPIVLNPAAAGATAGESYPNTVTAIRPRWQSGAIVLAWPLLLLLARTLLAPLAQGVVALILAWQGDATPWLSAAPWWSVYGTLVDLGCLLALWAATRREGLRLADLWNLRRPQLGRDALLGLGLFVLLFPTVIMGGTLLASWLVYGTLQPPVMATISGRGVLPWWAMLYSLAVWWFIWSPTEDMTYAGYTLPRLEAITGRPWAAVLLVAFFWAFHHALFPLVPDWRYLLWRFLVFAPVALAFPLLYRRLGRLLPLTVAHWCMDWLGVVFTVV